MSAKQLYGIWCAQQVHLPIFVQPWWMDIVCGDKDWDVLLFRSGDLSMDNQNRIVAAMPILARERVGVQYILMPPMTQLGGVCLDEKIEWNTQLLYCLSMVIYNRLQAMKVDYFRQNFAIRSPLPNLLQLHGFQLHKRVTYRLENVQNLETIRHGFSRNKLRQLRKATSLRVHYQVNADSLYQLHANSLSSKGKHISYSRLLLNRLVDEVMVHKCGETIGLYDSSAQLQAAALVVKDADAAHYLIAAVSPEAERQGAMARLVLEAIIWAKTQQVAFDFEGSMIPGVANHFRQFGAVATPYYGIERCFTGIGYVFQWVCRLWEWKNNLR